jgi:hypothetical protein
LSDAQILFLASRKFDSDKAIRGALLLTDTDTKPLEFRCTNPIRPTSLQTVLYGQMLQRHIMVELIGVPLLNSLKQPPSVVLVKEPDFLWLRAKVSVPVLQVTKESGLDFSSADSDDKRTTLLSSHSGQFEPVVLAAHTDFGDDMSTSVPILTQVFNRFDLLEPFQRVLTALEQVHQQKIGEAK